MKTVVTLRQYAERYQAMRAYLPTYFGNLPISGVDKEWRVVTGKGLSQRTFTCHPDRRVVILS